MELSRTTVERWWDVLVEGYKEASKFMADQGILSGYILPYSTMIIPLTAIFADVHRKGEVAWGQLGPRSGSGTGAASSASAMAPVESNSAVDFEQVVGGLREDHSPKQFAPLRSRSDALQEIASIRMPYTKEFYASWQIMEPQISVAAVALIQPFFTRLAKIITTSSPQRP